VFLNALCDARSLTQAAEAALGEAPSFELSRMLALLLEGRAITAIIPPKE